MVIPWGGGDDMHPAIRALEYYDFLFSVESPLTVPKDIKNPTKTEYNEFLMGKVGDFQQGFTRCKDYKIREFVRQRGVGKMIVLATVKKIYKSLKTSDYTDDFLKSYGINRNEFFKPEKQRTVHAISVILDSITFDEMHEIAQPSALWNQKTRLTKKTIDGKPMPECWFAISFKWSGDTEHRRAIRIDTQGNVCDYGFADEMCWY